MASTNADVSPGSIDKMFMLLLSRGKRGGVSTARSQLARHPKINLHSQGGWHSLGGQSSPPYVLVLPFGA